MNDLTLITPPPGLTGADYAAIEQAVMETARGRWFLLEYARRQRAAETQRLADAITRLESLIDAETAARAVEPASPAAGAIAEKLSDILWLLREAGFDDRLCAEFEQQIALVRRLDGRPQAEPAEPAREEPADAPCRTPACADEDGFSPEETPRSDATATPSTAPGVGAPAVDPRIAALSRLDALPLAEKLALFC